MFINHDQPQKKRKSRFPYIFFVLYLVTIFSIEQIYREPFKNLSLDIIKNIQKLPEEKKNSLYKAFEIISFLGYQYPFITLTLIVYNFCNIFKTFILLSSLFLSSYLDGSLKMIYRGRRPYFIDEIDPVDNQSGWGNPSGQAIYTTAFYLSIWHMIFQNSKIRNKNFIKYFTLVLTIILISGIMASRVILASQTISDLIFGGSLGFAIYFLLYFVLDIETNKSEQLESFLKTKNIIYFLVNFILLIFICLLYFLNNDPSEEAIIRDIIFNKYKKIGIVKHENDILQNEAFTQASLFFANFGLFIAMKFELFFVFKGSYNDWRLYNFNDKDFNDNESLMTSLTPVNNLTQWNHTTIFLDFFRLLIVFLMIFLINYPFLYIPHDSHIILLFLFKYMFPLGLSCFFLFFALKSILKCLKLTNSTFYSRLIYSSEIPFP